MSRARWVLLTLEESAALVALIREWDEQNRDNVTPTAIDLRRAEVKIVSAAAAAEE